MSRAEYAMLRLPIAAPYAKGCLGGTLDLRSPIWQKTFSSEEGGIYEDLQATDMVRPVVPRGGHGLFD